MTPAELDLDALEAALAHVKGPWLSLPGDPAFALECDERDRAEFARDKALRNAAPALIAAARRGVELEAALIKAIVQFQEYANHHAAKGTPDGLEKSLRNHKLATELQAALEPKP